MVLPIEGIIEKKKEMGEGERFQLGTVGALTLSVISSVSIVICNKALISSLGFHFGMFYILQPLPLLIMLAKHSWSFNSLPSDNPLMDLYVAVCFIKNLRLYWVCFFVFTSIVIDMVYVLTKGTDLCYCKLGIKVV